MTALENFVSPALMRALGWTLLHSLWQGALVAAVLAGALLLLRRQRAEVRYVASAGALGVVVALAGITFGLYFNAGSQKSPLLSPPAVKSNAVSPFRQKVKPAARARPIRLAAAEAERQPSCLIAAFDAAPATAAGLGATPADAAAAPVNSSSKAGWLAAGLRYFDNHLPLFVVAWLLGLLAMSLRMLGGLLYVQRLRRYRVRPLNAAWQARFAALAERSGVRRPVALMESALVQVPLVIGHLRPVILLPLGVVAGLSPASLEAILAHELAHVLRRDYLVNLLQTAAEVLFFYHPAVWFVANCVRTERENCCDDTATALCGGDSLRLARALTALAEWSQSAVVPPAPRLALAAMGKRGALLSRVRRLVQRRPAAPTLAEGIMAGALVLGGLGLLGSSVALAGPLTQPAAAVGQASSGDTIKFGKAMPAEGTFLRLPFPTSALDAEGQRLALAKDEFGATRLVLEQDTTLRGRRTARARSNRRVIINSPRAVTPFRSNSFRNDPGTVVITKDKKGRLTDLVVNGQRVETEVASGTSGKRKLKLKEKGGKAGKNQQFEVIRMVPQNSPDARTFVYRGDGVTTYSGRSASPSVAYGTLVPSTGQTFYRDLVPSSAYGEGGRSRTYRIATAVPLTSLEATRAQREAAVSQREALRTQRESLRKAESALRKASTAKSLSAADRKNIQKELADLRARIKELDAESKTAAPQVLRFSGSNVQVLEPTLSISAEGMQLSQDGGKQDRQEDVREKRREELRERIRESQQELREIDRERSERSRQNSERIRQNEEALVSELLKDGLIKSRNNFQLKLTSSGLVLDGKEQPNSVFQKYLKLYESTSNRKLTAANSLIITRSGDSNTAIFSDNTPRPPRPPREPRAPRAPAAPGVPAAPGAPAAPQAPRPPRAPSIDTRSLRNELRNDGLIGQTDRSFEMQLNDAGLTINGKRQSDELAAKYRKLVGHDRPGQVHNLSVSFDD